MARRRVAHTSKAIDGDITGICGLWGTRSVLVHVGKVRAIHQIRHEIHNCYVREGGVTASVIVAGPAGREYLTAIADSISTTNLANLSDC